MKKTNMIKSMLCVGIAFGMVLGSVLSGQAETEEQGKDYEVSLEGAKQYINDKYLLKIHYAQSAGDADICSKMKKVKNEEDIYVGDAIQIFDPDGNGNGKEQKAEVDFEIKYEDDVLFLFHVSYTGGEWILQNSAEYKVDVLKKLKEPVDKYVFYVINNSWYAESESEKVFLYSIAADEEDVLSQAEIHFLAMPFLEKKKTAETGFEKLQDVMQYRDDDMIKRLKGNVVKYSETEDKIPVSVWVCVGILGISLVGIVVYKYRIKLLEELI